MISSLINLIFGTSKRSTDDVIFDAQRSLHRVEMSQKRRQLEQRRREWRSRPVGRR